MPGTTGPSARSRPRRLGPLRAALGLGLAIALLALAPAAQAAPSHPAREIGSVP